MGLKKQLEKIEKLIKAIDFALIKKEVHDIVKLKTLTLDTDNIYKALNHELVIKAIHDSDWTEFRRWWNKETEKIVMILQLMVVIILQKLVIM